MPRTLPLLAAALLVLAARASAQLAGEPVDLWQQTSPGLDLPEQEDAYFGAALAAGDFDGDGFEDLAIGVPEYDLTELDDVGLVVVTYGGPAGPTATAHDLWTQDHVLLLDDGEENDRFGAALVAGDFDGDGFDDLAIGVPGEEIDGDDSAGAVQVLYGSASGLGTDDQLFHQGWGGVVLGTAEPSDRFGSTLAAGDFDGDGLDDLAVGVPYEQVSAEVGAGAFHVLFGAAGGLTTDGDLLFYLGNGLPGAPGAGENLSWSLAAGDFVPQAKGDELAVGAPGTSVDGAVQAGVVWIVSHLDGTPSAWTLDLDAAGMPDAPQTGDQLGCALTAGSFDGVGAEDLAITACRKPAGGQDDAGKVYLWYGSARPGVALDQAGLPGEQPDLDDFFGSALATADVDADGVDDLLIGVPFEDLGGESDAGVVHVLRGAHDAGVTKLGAVTLEQTESDSEWDDRFGQALVAGRFAGHSGTDVAVGAPRETAEPLEWAGAVHVFHSIALFVDDLESGDTSAWSAKSIDP